MAGTTRKNGGLPNWGVNRDYWVSVGDEPFLDRKVLVITPWFGVFLTDIHKPDIGRDPHDHSRPFISFILSGGYVEVVHDNPEKLGELTRHFRTRFSAHRMKMTEAHNITVVDKNTRTLVFAGKSRGTWSFWTDDGKVDWKQYK
jgi:hypothetical protein